MTDKNIVLEKFFLFPCERVHPFRVQSPLLNILKVLCCFVFSPVCPPPEPPEFSKPFSRVLNVLCCKTLIKLMNRVLTRAGSGISKSWSDIQIQEVYPPGTTLRVRIEEVIISRNFACLPKSEFRKCKIAWNVVLLFLFAHKSQKYRRYLFTTFCNVH